MANYNLSTATGVFKTKYVRMSRDMFNSENVVLAKIKRNDVFVGDQAIISVPTTFGGGRGSGVLPRANATNYAKMLITSKRTYALVEVDNEAIKASQTDEGAFVRLSKEPVKRGVQGWQGNASRILFNDATSNGGIGNGRLGRFTATPANISAGVYDIVILSSGDGAFKLANWEPKDYVNVVPSSGAYAGYGTGTEFEITNVTASSNTIRLTHTNGPLFDLALLSGPSDNEVYMQNSKGNDPTGLRGALLATSGSLYNVNIGYRWQAPSQIAAASAGITTDLLNKQVLDIKYSFGETPDMFVTSFVQYRKLLNQLEDQKRYMIVESRNAGPRGKFSFQALEFMADTGPIPVIAERFVENDTLYTLNSAFIEMHARPEGGWIEDPTANGSIFRQSPTSDTWQARYAVYFEFGIIPSAHGIITGLSTT
ncbi:MAG: phage major capsid protein [Desulfurellales bacterium]|nr:MAG: phage major capsid protein [Desulfurellales bacterium]